MTQALGLKVLVADDTAANRNMMEAFLRKLGFSCVTARDGREALQVFEQAQPDLVLMDLMMPEMDGFEATRLIRQQQGARWVPVVILSALSTEEDIIAGLDCGADDYLTKPIRSAVFRPDAHHDPPAVDAAFGGRCARAGEFDLERGHRRGRVDRRARHHPVEQPPLAQCSVTTPTS